MLFTLDIFTIVACSVILVAFIASWIYVSNIKNDDLPKRRKWIDQLPSVISTLGVLGTFLGITRGLMSFDTATLDQSIPVLLDGLKTAFFTSLLGMSGSLVLNRIVSLKFDKDLKSSEIEKAARMIINAMSANQRELPKFLEEANKNFVTILSQDETVKIIKQDVEQMKDDIEELKGINQELRSVLDNISSSNSAVAEELPRLRAVAVTATASISAIDNNVEDINKAVSSLDNNISKLSEKVESDTEDVKSSLSSISGFAENIRDVVNEINNHIAGEEDY